jgi:hypothetical protein
LLILALSLVALVIAAFGALPRNRLLAGVLVAGVVEQCVLWLLLSRFDAIARGDGTGAIDPPRVRRVAWVGGAFGAVLSAAVGARDLPTLVETAMLGAFLGCIVAIVGRRIPGAGH